MSDVSWASFAKGFLIAAACLLVVGGIVYGIVRFEEGTGPDTRATERAIRTACLPGKNIGVDYHGSSWSESDRYEVTCADGSQRIVYPRYR